jgi:diaminopimelate epimerase
MTVETGAGILELELRLDGTEVRSVRVSMGRPRLERSEIPMLGPPGRVVGETLEAAGRSLTITALSMGNPHCIVYVDDVQSFPVAEVGPALENHPAFPRRTNVEFVQVLSPGEVRQRTWERGAGETLACGTGASAVCAAGLLTGRTGERLLNHLAGGDLLLEWDGKGPVFMEGPAREVFRGVWVG